MDLTRPLMRKRISRLTAETLPWYLRLYGVMIGASIPEEDARNVGSPSNAKIF